MILLWIALGGAAGAVARYAFDGWIHRRAGAVFPWGTLGANLAGCFLLGLALPFIVEASTGRVQLRALLAVGFLGDFTTFSYESLALLRERGWGALAGYVSSSVAVGMLGIVAGLFTSNSLL